MTIHPHPSLPVAIIGAGPVGLAAAAELAFRGIPAIVLEAGAQVGTQMLAWGHVRMFSPWQYNISRAARLLLEPTGWRMPAPETIPTGREVVERYLRPLADLPAMRSGLRLSTRVLAVTRAGLDKVKTADRAERPFVLRVIGEGQGGGREEDVLARAVIDCSGTFSQPSPGGAHGIPARGEIRHAGNILYGTPDILGGDRARYAGKRVAVLGSGHSAIGAILDLVELKQTEPATKILWLSRRQDLRLAFGGGVKDGLPARGALGSRLQQAVIDGIVQAVHPFALEAIEAEPDHRLRLTSSRHSGEAATVIVDELVVATGFRPDLSLLGEVRLDLDPALECPRALAPLIDPNIHSCGTVRPHGAKELGQPEAGFYLAGMKSYGRAPTFLLATGHEQVRSIVAEIAGDHAAAARVELELPETGVCSTDFPARTPGKNLTENTGCRGGPAKADASACCVKDEIARQAGETGCGCGARSAPEALRDPIPALAREKPSAACCG